MDGLGPLIRTPSKNSLGQSYLGSPIVASGEDVHQVTDPSPSRLHDEPDPISSKPTVAVTSGQDGVLRRILLVPPLEICSVADHDDRVVRAYRVPESVELLGEGRLSGQEGRTARCPNREEV